MVKRILSNKIIKDIIIVAAGAAIIYGGLYIAFGINPFYVVASGSMVPVLQVNDVLIVQGRIPFADIEVGDIIVFNRPSGHERVIVHRVEAIIDDEPKTIRAKGDANPTSIPGTDFPIKEHDYIGKVVYTIPEIGYIPKLIKPPVNYIIIAVIIGIVAIKYKYGGKKPEISTKKSDDDQEDKESSTRDNISTESDNSHSDDSQSNKTKDRDDSKDKDIT